MASAYPPKDPAAILDYAFDWAAWLAVGETLSSFTLTADAGITIQTSPAAAISGTKVVWWLAGGAAGTFYNLYLTITTNQGRTDRRTLQVEVAARSGT